MRAFQALKILGVTIAILSNISNISSSEGSVTPLNTTVLPYRVCLWAPATAGSALSFAFKIEQFTGSVKYCKSSFRASLRGREVLFETVLQFYVAISCQLSACCSCPVPLLAELAAFPSPRGGISRCCLASTLFTLKHPCRNGKKQRSC